MIVGATVCLGAYALIKWANKEEWTLEGTLASLVGGAAIACVPDILEPALNPNHRGFLHSSLTFAGAYYAGVKIWKSSTLKSDDKTKLLIALLAYLSHLTLDAATPKGLPLGL